MATGVRVAAARRGTRRGDAGGLRAGLARVPREAPSGAYRLLVACAGEEVVGFAAVGPSTDPDATDVDGELLVGGVSPGARRAGHGSRLLNATVDTAGLTGFARVRTWLLAADEATRAFLEAAGFAPDGARRERVTGPAEGDVAGDPAHCGRAAVRSLSRLSRRTAR